MRRINLKTNFTGFLLFFGLVTLETFQSGNWIKAAFWLDIGLVFLLTDNLRALAGHRGSRRQAATPATVTTVRLSVSGDDAIDE